jgi:hypothetical protein
MLAKADNRCGGLQIELRSQACRTEEYETQLLVFFFQERPSG